MNIDFWIKQNFGSKKGMVRFFYFQFLLKVGFYRRYKNIDFSKINRLVFVCTGNICRSPFAEAVAKKMNVNAFSFGLDTRGGDAADPRAIDYAILHRFDLSSHVTKTLADYIAETGDLLVLMEPEHLQVLPESLRNIDITFAGLWLPEPQVYLHDPYNTCIEYFNQCESLVQVSVEVIAKELIRHGR